MTSRNAASQDPEQIKNLLLMREHARADAWLRKDRRALDALLAPDFVETSGLGRFTKAELLDRLFPVLTLHEYVIGTPVLTLPGEDTAVLTYRCTEHLTAGKRDIAGAFLVTATYAREGQQYRLKAWDSKPVG